MFGMWDVWHIGCSGSGMFGMWDVRDVGCSGCGMFAGMLDVYLQSPNSGNTYSTETLIAKYVFLTMWKYSKILVL